MFDSLVIIPTYNEKQNVERIIRTVFALTEPFDVLIIDDGSPDGTGGIVKTLQAEFPGQLHLVEREGKLGLGTAYIRGFQWALERDYTYICEMDADFSHNPQDLIILRQECRQNSAALAIGSRYVTGVNVVNWPMRRVLMSYFASVYVRLVTRMKIMDTTSGFKCYTRDLLKTIDFTSIQAKGYAFQIEMKFLTWKHGFKISELPIIFTDRQDGISKMSGGIFKEAILGVLKMKLLSFFKSYPKSS